jgi:hypothetical protein
LVDRDAVPHILTVRLDTKHPRETLRRRTTGRNQATGNTCATRWPCRPTITITRLGIHAWLLRRKAEQPRQTPRGTGRPPSRTCAPKVYPHRYPQPSEPPVERTIRHRRIPIREPRSSRSRLHVRRAESDRQLTQCGRLGPEPSVCGAGELWYAKGNAGEHQPKNRGCCESGTRNQQLDWKDRNEEEEGRHYTGELHRVLFLDVVVVQVITTAGMLSFWRLSGLDILMTFIGMLCARRFEPMVYKYGTAPSMDFGYRETFQSYINVQDIFKRSSRYHRP